MKLRPRSSRLTLLLAGVLLLSSASSATGAVDLTSGVSSSGNALRPWLPDFFGTDHTRTRTEAVADAKNFDMIVASTRTYSRHSGAMHAANPRLDILVYYNGAFSHRDREGPFPESWYLHDSNGRRIYNVPWPKLYLMDPSNPGWIDNRARTCASLIASSGYDGCVLDNMGTAVLERGYVSALPIDPDTRRVYTRDKWHRDASKLIAAVNNRVSPKLVMANGLRSGSHYFDDAAPSSVLLTAADGGMPEAFCRLAKSGISAYPGESAWKADVDMVADAGRKGKTILAVTKVWTSGTQAQKDAWHEYCLGTFLLGTNGRSFFFFSYREGDSVRVVHRWWGTEVGSPLAAYSKSGGVYVRPFTNGKVVVNPTSSTYTISLGGTYVDLAGIRRTSVTLGPHTAEILRKP